MLQSNECAFAQDKLLRLVTDIVAAYVSKNAVETTELPGIIRSVYAALVSLSATGPAVPLTIQKPAVPVKKSVTNEYIVCLEDGQKLKMLKRYLRVRYKLSPNQYREKWGLPADYPMVAPNYAELRSDFAKKIGLGKRKGPRTRRR